MTYDISSDKVFCVGFQKTGTTSLGKALNIMGYKVQGYYPFRSMAQKKDLTFDDIWECAKDVLHKYDAFKDTPWPVLYKRLDREFPNAKFILIKRDPERWIKSVTDDFGNYPNQIHHLIYGSAFPLGNERSWIDRYNFHNREVEKYFADQKQRFVSLEMDKGECNWNSVCAFLNKPVPDMPWPHANTKRAKRVNMIWWKAQEKLRQVLVSDSN